MGAISFVRMDVPPIILSLLTVLAKLHPEVLRGEYKSQEERKNKPSRPRRSPSPGAQSSPSERLCTISALGIQRTSWRYVASFAGLGTMFDVARALGGEPACGSDNHGLARALWQQRTKRVCFSSFATYRTMLTDPEQRAHHLARVLIYLPAPPRASIFRSPVASVAQTATQVNFFSTTPKAHWKRMHRSPFPKLY